MVWILIIKSDSELWEMLMCGLNQHQDSLTLFRGNLHGVTLEKRRFAPLAQNRHQSDQRHCGLGSPHPADCRYLSCSGGKNKRKEIDRERVFILKINVLI